MSKTEPITITILAALLVMVSGVLYVTSGGNDDHRPNMEAVTKNAIVSTLEIRCTMDGAPGESAGTGFVISYGGRNVVVTNAHVILPDMDVDETYDNIVSRFYDSSTEHRLDPISWDADLDIAVLEFEDAGLSVRPLRFGDSNGLVYAQDVIAIGNALGGGLSVKSGIVSIPHVTIAEGSFVRVDMNINPGDSGAPVLDLNGNVVGMLAFRYPGDIQGMGFAIPSNVIGEYLKRELAP
jgi:S1-C subfamily serine protease